LKYNRSGLRRCSQQAILRLWATVGNIHLQRNIDSQW
jgi:hypothetical protein